MKNYLKFPSISFLLIVSAFTLLQAQEVDHIYLKSGSVIRGQILEMEPVDHVKIQDLCGNIWYYKTIEVEKITSEPFDPPALAKNRNGFHTGFVNMTSIGFLAGSSNNTQVAPFSLLMVNGWRSVTGVFCWGRPGNRISHHQLSSLVPGSEIRSDRERCGTLSGGKRRLFLSPERRVHRI